MSGHNSFTEWVECEAGYIFHNGIRKEIKDCYFTSDDGCHNSDIFIIVTNTLEHIKLYEVAQELRQRFNDRL